MSLEQYKDASRKELWDILQIQMQVLQAEAAKVVELEKSLIAPTDSGVVALDSICEKFNSNKESDLTELTCSIWNKAFFEALKEQVK
tara:strand:+ start:162 stop:422 length:261 start_codon:yes stop_codon:yes gene_type:complete